MVRAANSKKDLERNIEWGYLLAQLRDWDRNIEG